MIVMRHRASGAVAIVASLGGHGEPVWEQIGPLPAGVPADLAMIAADGTITADLDAARARRWAAIKAEREQRLRVAPTSGGPLDVDETGRSNILGMVQAINLLGEQVPEPIIWKRADNVLGHFSREEFRDVALEALGHIQAVYQASFQIEAAINAATTLAEIEAVTWPVA
jgi:hypothetical protein